MQFKRSYQKLVFIVVHREGERTPSRKRIASVISAILKGSIPAIFIQNCLRINPAEDKQVTAILHTLFYVFVYAV